jgi:uncharacterized membrane protein YdjX (TVP38/TMEM64 family)
MLVLWLFLPLDAWLESLAVLAEDHPATALALFCALYIGGAFVLIPVTPLALAGGWLWGLWWGSALVFVVGMIADILPFLTLRTLGARLPKDVEGRAGEVLAKLEHYSHVNGFVLVLLLRWLPIAPFNLMNYALAMSRVTFRDYVWATAIACAPTTVLCAYAGTLAPGGKAPAGVIGSTPYGVGIVTLGVIAVIGLSHVAKRVLESSPAPEAGP